MVTWEGFYAAVLMAGAACCYRRHLYSSAPGSNRPAVLLGCFVGVLVLTSPTAAIVCIGRLAWLFWKERLGALKSSHLVLILLPVVIVAPWIIRNYLVFDRYILVRDNLGLELTVSNSDGARFGLDVNIQSGHFDEVYPYRNIEEAEKVLAHGERAVQ